MIAGEAGFLARHEAEREDEEWIQSPGAGELRVGDVADADDAAAALDHGKTAPERLAALGVEDEVEIGEHFVELLRAVVDDLIGAQLAHQLDVARADGGGHVTAEVLRELDRERPDAARSSVDQDALPRL